jgi:hypothetical protein
MHHNLGDQDDAIADSTYVLENLDSKNPKALLRRSFGNRTYSRWSDAVKDLQELNKVTNNEDAKVKKDLNFCLGKFMET